MASFPSFHASHQWLLMSALGVLAGASTLSAQYGASPSQTGLFFDDLRARANQSNLGAGAGVRSGETVYDYDRGVYTNPAGDERQMGQAQSVAGLNEAAREMGQPAYRSGSNAFAARAAGDYTYYSGQYASPSTFFAPTYVSDPFLGGRRNLKIGGVNMGFGLFSSVEYNDNVTRSSVDPVDDIIGSMLLNIDANYQITQNNRLTLTTAVGFDHYFNNPDVAPYGTGDFVLNVLPGSTLAFDIKAGPVFITLYDRISVRPAVRNEFALAANQIFGVFQNDAGLAAMWEINSSLSFSMNYLHSNARALEEQFEIFDRDMDSIQANLTWRPSGTWSLGLEGGISWVRYPEGFNNDGVLSNGGVVFATPLGNSSFLRASAGVQNFSFDAPPPLEFSEADVKEAEDRTAQAERILAREQANLLAGNYTGTEAEQQKRVARAQDDANQAAFVRETRKRVRAEELAGNTQDASDLNDFYYNVTLTNQLSARVTQVLAFGHESALGNVSNFITADYINYGIGIIAWRGSRLSVSAYYEDAEMSGGQQSEDLEQYGLDVYLSHQFNSRVRVGAGYHYGVTDSELAGRDFVQNAFSADFSYSISPKATLSLGYRFFTTDADDNVNDFDQNRVVMALNYNF
jgi:hypothetical protein